jgi:sugar lactone lactonase YvrE
LKEDFMAVRPVTLSYYLALFMTAFVLASSARAQAPGNISTVAGNGQGFGSPNGSGGPALNAVIGGPSDVAYGPDGSLYIASEENQRVWRVESNGTARIFAGTGSPDFSGDGGPATAAKLRSPRSVAVDASGNVYIGDGGNNKIRRVDAATKNITTVTDTTAHPNFATMDMVISGDTLTFTDGHQVKALNLTNGQISVVMGKPLNENGSACNDRVSAGASPLEACPILAVGLALGPDGSLYVSTRGNEIIFRISPERSQIFFAVDVLPFDYPYGLAVDGKGSLYVAGRYNHRIYKVIDGAVNTIAGSGPEGQGNGGFAGDGGPASTARLNEPKGIVLDGNGNLLVADARNNRIRTIGGATSFCPDCPPNDNIESAIELTGAEGSIDGTNLHATEEGDDFPLSSHEPYHDGQLHLPWKSVWYKWRPQARSNVQFWTEGSVDTVMAFYYTSGGSNSLATGKSNDDRTPVDKNSEVSWAEYTMEADPTQTYYIAIDTYDGGGGAFKLNWKVTPIPPPAPPLTISQVVPPVVRHHPNIEENVEITLLGQGFTDGIRVYYESDPMVMGVIQNDMIQFSVPKRIFSASGNKGFRVEQDGTRNFVFIDVIPFESVQVPAGGSATVSTPVHDPNKRGSSLTVTAQNAGGGPVDLTAATYGGLAQNRGNSTGGTPIGSQSGFGVHGSLPPGSQAQVSHQPGGGVISRDGASVISRDTAGIIGKGGAGIVGSNSGAVIANGGNNIVALGGGNVIALGGGNVINGNGSTLTGGGRLPLQSTPNPLILVRGSGGVKPGYEVVEGANGTESVQTTILFDDTSTPKVTELADKLFYPVSLLYGDINFDAQVNISDAILVLQQVVGVVHLSEIQLEVGDVFPNPGVGPNTGRGGGDGTLDVSDAVKILRHIVGLP